MPILGVIASSTRQGQNVDTGAMFPLQVITVGPAGASSVSFTNIPSTYTHLQIRGIARSASTNPNLTLRINGDATSSYTEHYFIGNGSTILVGGTASTAFGYLGNNAPSTTSANNFGVSILDILDYADTNKFKTVRALSGYDDNGSGIVSLRSTVFQKTNAITSLTIAIEGGANFVQYSSFALYAVKGA